MRSDHLDRNRPAAARLRVGFFGLLGSGNLGNDASLEVVLARLRAEHPDAAFDAMCMGPEEVADRYGIDAIPLLWSRRHAGRTSGAASVSYRALGKGLDVLRTASWVRRHDVVVVPGAGVLETSTPLRATSMPLELFLLSASGKLGGTDVALVGVGATEVNQRLTRWLFDAAARLASYRSYRDPVSRHALAARGVDTTGDEVYADLVFGLEPPRSSPGDPLSVGVGVMDFYGGADDRSRADELHERYSHAITSFVRWLVDHGYRVRLLPGDRVDEPFMRSVLADVRAHRPDLAADMVVAHPVSRLQDLMDEIAPVGAVVGTRYHNVLSALMLCKPTISVGYAAKHDAIMAAMGVPEFSLAARSVDIDQLVERFTALQGRSSDVRRILAAANQEQAGRIDRQFCDLSSSLLSTPRPASRPAAAVMIAGEPGRGAVAAGGSTGRGLHRPAGGGTAATTSAPAAGDIRYYKKDFWSTEGQKFVEPHHRLRKSARLINEIAGWRPCTLLDVGCGPATLMGLLRPNISYHGIDIAVRRPMPYLQEADLVASPIDFDGRQFDIAVAQGLFEYLGDRQGEKFAEIAQIVRDDGTFLVSYVNFGHHRRTIYWPYSNIQPIGTFRSSLEEHFAIRRVVPTAHNWNHSEPRRPWLQAVNMHVNVTVPLVSPKLAVEYFFVCSARR